MGAIFKFMMFDEIKGPWQLSGPGWRRALGVNIPVPRVGGWNLFPFCDLGHIDPRGTQHHSPRTACRCDGEGRDCPGGYDVWPVPAPTDSACTFAGRIHEPGNASWDQVYDLDDSNTPVPFLVTTRPSVDTIAAMAVLVLRALGFLPPFDADEAARDTMRGGYELLSTEETIAAARKRLELIAARDAIAPERAWRPRDLPTWLEPWPKTQAPIAETKELGAVRVLCTPAPDQKPRPLHERVALVACWVLLGQPVPMGGWGDLPDALPTCSGILAACGVDMGTLQYTMSTRAWCELALCDAADTATGVRLGLASDVDSGWIHPYSATCIVEGGVPFQAIAISDRMSTESVDVAFCMAPIVLATTPPPRDPVHGRATTVVAWRADILDMEALVRELNDAEEWARAMLSDAAGSAAMALAKETVAASPWSIVDGRMVRSPQGNGTFLSVETVLRIVGDNVNVEAVKSLAAE